MVPLAGSALTKGKQEKQFLNAENMAPANRPEKK
jgi:hypothetical protein